MPCHLRVILAAALLWAAAVPCAEKEPEGSYELHEWGVFSVPRNDAWAQRDMRQEWSEMPKEFYGRMKGRSLPYRGAVKKPVIFFHANKAMQVTLAIRFAQGCPVVWWPAAEEPSTGGFNEGRNSDRLIFSAYLKEPPQKRGERTIDVPAKHWVETLRSVKSEKVFCLGSYTNKMPGEQWDSESFIYYDGLMKAPASPKVARDGEALVLETPGDQVCLDLMVIDHSEKGVRVAKSWTEWTGVLDATIRKSRIETVPATADDLKRIGKELTERLAKADLNSDEAESLVNVWDEGLFKKDGLTVFYRIPQATYEKWLPLEAKPAPSKTVRVGLVLHEHLEPELDAHVATLIKKLGAESFEERSAAQKELTAIGGASFPALEKASESDDAEISKACRAILNALDAIPELKGIEKK